MREYIADVIDSFSYGVEMPNQTMSDETIETVKIKPKSCMVVLAAGKGTRMKSALPKVMHKLAGQPMIGRLFKTGREAGFSKIVLVTSPDQAAVRHEVQKMDPEIIHATQQEPLGTGNAAASAVDQIGDSEIIVIVFGDTPLLREEILSDMLATTSDLLVLGFVPHNPAQFGRIILEQSHPVKIVEFKDADETTKNIRLCNGGAMAIRADIFRELLPKLNNENAQGEYYLPDLVGLAYEAGYKTALIEGAPDDVLGVDNRAVLAHAEHIIQERMRHEFMMSGVTLEDPSSVYFYHDTKIQPDVYIEPNVRFGPNVEVETGAHIHAFCHIEGAYIGQGVHVGPFARLRQGTKLSRGAKIGNFVETKNATIGEGSKANHLTYLGDTVIGEASNIGAGTITCNYDGFNKHQTLIGDGVFVGSNSSLIAPVEISDGAYIGSGSAISGSVASDDLVLTRAPLRTIRGWARKFRNRFKKG